MAINWEGLRGNLEHPSAEISNHSLSHKEKGGYHATNFPTGRRYKDEWRDLMDSGSELHEYWKSSGDDLLTSYIIAPFCGGFIYIKPSKKMSGPRTAIEMHSMFCEEPEHLVREVVDTLGGVKEPPAKSIHLSQSKDDYRTLWSENHGIESALVIGEPGIGLSSWLFQQSRLRPVTGVVCGFAEYQVRTVLMDMFPEASRWIIEEVGKSPPWGPGDALQTLVYGKGGVDYEGRGGGTLMMTKTLDEYYMLEQISDAFEIDLQTLLPIYIKDEEEGFNDIDSIFDVKQGDEIEARMILGDRTEPLRMLSVDPRLINHWMKYARTKHSGLYFPFSEEEMKLLLMDQGADRCLAIFSQTLSMMSEYSEESRILMARAITRVGGQRVIEHTWAEVGPIGRNQLQTIMQDIFEWRTNDAISDFWGLLAILEGGTGDLVFRRNLATQIVSNSARPSDIDGLVAYIPNLIISPDNYDADWGILESVGSNANKTLLRINQLQPSGDKIQLRIALFIERKGAPRSDWSISGLTPKNSHQLIGEYSWIRPILIAVDKQKMYDAKFPSDGFVWMQQLTPKGYLSCLEDPEMGGFVRAQRSFQTERSQGWKRPRAISHDLGMDSPEWSKKEAWARLIHRPSIREKLAYYGEYVTLLLSLISMLIIAYCVIIIPPLVSTGGGDSLLGAALSASWIALALAVDRLRSGFADSHRGGSSTTLAAAIVAIFATLGISAYAANVVELSFEGKMSVIAVDMASYSIPAPNSPFLTCILVVVFWQVNRIMREAHYERVQMREHLYASLGIA